jgi:hypothetical protein
LREPNAPKLEPDKHTNAAAASASRDQLTKEESTLALHALDKSIAFHQVAPR